MPSHRLRVLVALVVALLIGLAAGLWIGGDSGPEPHSTPSGQGEIDSSGAQEVINGVPVGYPRTESGAVSAATNFARIMASISLDATSYRAAIKTLAAPAWQTEAEELADSGIQFFSERYGTSGSLTFTPVRYRVVSYSQASVTVELWGVSVASGPKVTGIEESWVTGTVQLIWHDGDWRVSGQQSQTGPTPELLTTDDERSFTDLDEFSEYEHAPAP